MADTAPEALTAESLIDTMLAYRRTALLRTGLETGVFDAMAGGPVRAEEVSGRLGLDGRATAILLGALAAVGLAVSDGPGYALPPGGADLLARSGSRYLGDGVSVAAGAEEWEALGSLTEAVRTGAPVRGFDACAPDFAYWERFAAHSTFVTRTGAAFLAETLEPWARPRDTLDVLDVGCGHGLFGLALAERFPSARVVGLDRPGVLREAERHARRAPSASRIAFLPGDAFDADLGGPYDLVLFGNILCQYPRRRAGELIGRAAATLRPGGRLAVAGFTAGDLPAEREYGGRMVSLLMLLWSRGGEAHSTGLYRDLLAEHGFDNTETHVRPGLPHRVLLFAPRP